PVPPGRRWSEGVGPERPGARGAAADLLDGHEAQVRVEADAQGARRNPAAPEDADHSIRDLPVCGAAPIDPDRLRRGVEGGRLKIPGQGRPLRPAPRLAPVAV